MLPAARTTLWIGTRIPILQHLQIVISSCHDILWLGPTSVHNIISWCNIWRQYIDMFYEVNMRAQHHPTLLNICWHKCTYDNSKESIIHITVFHFTNRFYKMLTSNNTFWLEVSWYTLISYHCNMKLHELSSLEHISIWSLKCSHQCNMFITLYSN